MALPRARARNRGRARMESREAGHQERGFSPHMEGHKSHGSRVSMAQKGTGSHPGTDELQMPFVGPGVAARGYAGMDRSMAPTRETPTGAAPKGMSVYREE